MPVTIRGKEYVTVAERVQIVHSSDKAFQIIESGPMQAGADRILWKTVIKVDDRQYIGHAEVKMSANKNTPDGSNPFECAETSALGRALGFAGFGSGDSIASADEIIRHEMPVQSRASGPEFVEKEVVAPSAPAAIGFATAAQVKVIHMLQNQQGLSPEVGLEKMPFEKAAELIQALKGDKSPVVASQLRSNGEEPVGFHKRGNISGPPGQNRAFRMMR